MRIVICFLLISLVSKAQLDSAASLPLVGVHFGGQLPFSDMGTRFGPNLDAGGMFAYKTKRNWIFGAEGTYGFGRNVKEDVLKNLKTTDGFVIDNEGYPADLRISERVVGVHVFGGKIFHLTASNINSGIVATFGAGYMQHKINLYDAQQRIAAVHGDLKYGYDRLSNGVSVSQFIGYLNLSNNRLLNYYFGFTFYEAYTKSIRKLNYDTGLPDKKSRIDILSGFRVGWILPLYKRTPNNFYVN